MSVTKQGKSTKIPAEKLQNCSTSLQELSYKQFVFPIWTTVPQYGTLIIRQTYIRLRCYNIGMHILFSIKHGEEPHQTALVQCSLNWDSLH